MRRYRVSCFREESGSYYVEASNKKEAERIALQQLARGETFDFTTDDGGYGIYGVYEEI
jgi:hypothetical protein